MSMNCEGFAHSQGVLVMRLSIGATHCVISDETVFGVASRRVAEGVGSGLYDDAGAV